MNVDVRITGLLQRIDLETHDAANMLELTLPDGSCLTAPISEQDASRILHLAVGAPPPAQQEVYAPHRAVEAPRAPMRMDQDDVLIFGGEPSASAVTETVLSSPADIEAALRKAQERSTGMTSAAEASSRRSSYTNKEGVKTPIRTIASVDEMGNPILRGVNQSPMPEEGVDEDGVPSA